MDVLGVSNQVADSSVTDASAMTHLRIWAGLLNKKSVETQLIRFPQFEQLAMFYIGIPRLTWECWA